MEISVIGNADRKHAAVITAPPANGIPAFCRQP